MSDVGFQLETEEAFQQLAFRACDEGEASVNRSPSSVISHREKK
jgi:hypothetical protein